jgi:hypothetical protein
MELDLKVEAKEDCSLFASLGSDLVREYGL